MARKEAPEPSAITNRRARFDYQIDDEVEAGIVLMGSEVKSLRAGKANLQDAYAIERDEEIWLVNANIAEYPGANRFNHEPRRARKLLLHKKEIRKLVGKLRVKGYTLVPIRLFFNARGKVKILIGLGKGKKEFDKRDSIKAREWEREKARAVRTRP
ncbi:MAG: SsrA-binding protein SmpB [Rickettsiales bacterium]|jgi:SsrA-binding protein|nr:SsrA-binding protein SmpB [Rickettsiales bacterium]